MHQPDITGTEVADALAGAAKHVARILGSLAILIGSFGHYFDATPCWLIAAFLAGAATLATGLYAMLRAAGVPPQT